MIDLNLSKEEYAWRWQLAEEVVTRLKKELSSAEAQNQELEQLLYEARNPMLPDGSTITITEMYALWQASETRSQELEAHVGRLREALEAEAAVQAAALVCDLCQDESAYCEAHMEMALSAASKRKDALSSAPAESLERLRRLEVAVEAARCALKRYEDVDEKWSGFGGDRAARIAWAMAADLSAAISALDVEEKKDA